MPKVDKETLRKVEAAVERYKVEVDENPGLSSVSKRGYKYYAELFLRWLKDDFEPGIIARHR